jgi:tetratricopeptide (TPR) repeat protein
MGFFERTPEEEARAAATRAEREGNWIGAAELWGRLGDRERLRAAFARADFRERAAFFEEHSEWKQAAEAWERAKRPELSAAAFERAGEMRRAASLWAEAGNWTRAAESYTAAGDFADAASIYQRAGDRVRAGINWHQAGEYSRAFQVLFRRQQSEQGSSVGVPEEHRAFLPLVVDRWTLDFEGALADLLSAPETEPWKTLHAVAQSQASSLPPPLIIAIALRSGDVGFLLDWARTIFRSGAAASSQVRGVLTTWLKTHQLTGEYPARQVATAAPVALSAAWLAASVADTDAVCRHLRNAVAADPTRLDDALALLRTVADHHGKGRNGAYLVERIRLAVESL